MYSLITKDELIEHLWPSDLQRSDRCLYLNRLSFRLEVSSQSAIAFP